MPLDVQSWEAVSIDCVYMVTDGASCQTVSLLLRDVGNITSAVCAVLPETLRNLETA